MDRRSKRAIVGLLVVLSLSCSDGQRLTKGEQIMSNPDKLRELAERYTAAWCGQDPSNVAAFYAPTGSLRVNDGDPAVGRSAITEVAQGFMTAFPDMAVLMDDLLIQEDSVVYRWTLVGTNTGPGGTGRRVHISGHEVWQIGSDGLIAESQGHFDASDYQHQLEHGVGDQPQS